MSSTQFDVIVVGAGPGGASAAYDLAKAGARVALIEKAKLPRHKTCGGGVTYKVAQALPFDISSVVERTISTVVFSYKAGEPFEAHSPDPLVYMVRRNAFDQLLAQQATQVGTTLMDGCAVKSIDLQDGDSGVRVQTERDTLTARWLIGADGATGMVGKALGLMGNEQRVLMPAVESEIEVQPDVADYWHDKMGLDLGFLPASYGWVFPKGDHLNVGVGGIASGDDYGKQLKGYDAAHTQGRVPRYERVRKNFGYVLPLRKEGAPIVKGQAMLIGDAAGLVEAFTGEGIYWAVRSGQMAAQAITNGKTAADYSRQVDAELMPDLISARRWAHIYMWWPRLCYSLPRRWPPMWRAVRKIVRGERGYSYIRQKLGVLGFVEGLLPTGV